MVKVCSKCKVEKEVTEFHKNKIKKDGLNSRCKVCYKQYYEANKKHIKETSKKWYQDNKEHHNEYRKERKKNRRFI